YTYLPYRFLSDNKLSGEEGERGGLGPHKLKILHLSHNAITQFDAVLTLLPRLASLWLNFNQVTLRGREMSPTPTT
ncbi:hypothetical protein Hamer_G026792, partial [Homarus americanus]